jgi:cation transport ATPase
MNSAPKSYFLSRSTRKQKESKIKVKASQKRIMRSITVISILVILFIMISFIGFYLSSKEKNQGMYLDLIRLLMIFDVVLILIFWEFLKEEKIKQKRARNYTIRAAQKNRLTHQF